MTGFGVGIGHVLSKLTEDIHWFGPTGSPRDTTDSSHNVRITVGHRLGRGDQVFVTHGGQTPHIDVWDDYGKVLGQKTADERIPAGSFRDYRIDAYNNVRQGEDNSRRGYIG
jgi:hypothetical protein